MTQTLDVRGEFLWAEEVRGPLKYRRNRVVRVDGEPPQPTDDELYRSIFVSDATLSEYVDAQRESGSASGVRGFDGPCTVRYVPFDIDRDTGRDGEKHPDLDTAIADARKLLHYLELVHEVDLAVVECALSGRRGVHIRMPAEMFGGFRPSTNVPAVVKVVASALAGEPGVVIDESIYKRNHVLRVPNSRHPSGKYCVPVYAHELLSIEPGDLVSFMTGPRPAITWVGEAHPRQSLVRLRRESETSVLSKTRRVVSFPGSVRARTEEIRQLLLDCGIEFTTNGSDYVLRCPYEDHEDNEPSFRIHRDRGMYHCFGCGRKGSWEDFQESIQAGDGAKVKDDDDFTEVAKDIYTARQKKGRDDSRREFEIHTEVTAKIRRHLRACGRFYNDGQKAYFFFQKEKRLIEISGEADDFRLLLDRYGLNPTEQVYRWVAEALRNEALAHGHRTDVHRLAYYDPRRFLLFLYSHSDQIYCISCDRIDLVDNGTDGVLFLSDARAEPFGQVSISRDQSRLTEVVTSKINFADDVLTPGERQRIFELWFYSMFFESIMPTKPIVAFIGPKGSGKSITLRKVGMLLFGKKFDVTPLTNDSKDFDAAVANCAYVAFDNADHRCVWLNDRLAIVATGGTIKKRELYTTNKLVEIPVHCFVGITAHTPHFRRDDVADRLLIMKVERFTEFVSEKSLLTEVLESRDAIMTEVVHRLQHIVRALKASSGVDDSSSFRMADFADFATKVARYEGWENELKTIFEKSSHEQSEFTLEGDPIFETLTVWAKDNPDREVTYKELWEELKEVAEREGIDFQEYEKNSRRFVRRMPNIRSNLEEFFDIRDIPKGSRTVHHTFRLKEGE